MGMLLLPLRKLETNVHVSMLVPLMVMNVLCCDTPARVFSEPMSIDIVVSWDLVIQANPTWVYLKILLALPAGVLQSH